MATDTSALAGTNSQPQAPDMSSVLGNLPSASQTDTVNAVVNAPVAQPTLAQQPTQSTQQPSMFRSLLAGALLGMAQGASAKNFSGGVALGSSAVLQQKQQQTENQERQQQLSNETQQAYDNHTLAQANLADALVKHQMLVTQYNQMPKTLQDQLAQNEITAAHQQETAFGNQPVGTYQSTADAYKQASALNTAAAQKGDHFTRYTVLHREDGTAGVYALNDQKNREPIDIEMADGSKQTIPANTITSSDLFAAQARIATQKAAAQNKLDIQTAKNESAAAVQNLKNQGRLASAQFAASSPANQKTLLYHDKNYVQPALGVEKSYQMANDAFNEYEDAAKQGKQLPTGAQSMLMLSTHLSTTFGGVKGARVTKDMIQEHLGARSVSDGALVAVQKLTNGDQLSPQQWDAFHALITDSRKQSWQAAVNQAQRLHVPVDFLPQDLGGMQSTNAPANGQPKAATTPVTSSKPSAPPSKNPFRQ